MRNRYVSVSFMQGIKQNVPKTLLPLPLLTQASNLVVTDQGRLQSRLNFEQLSGAQLPPNTGTPLKLFVRDNQLFCVTTTHVLSYNKASQSWNDFTTSLDIGQPSRRNMDLSTFQITQKETDIKHIAFAQFGQNLVFFYTYTSPSSSTGSIFYKIWSIPNQRVIGGERVYTILNEDITGMQALNIGNALWLAVLYASDIRVMNFNPVTGRPIGSIWSPGTALPNIQRFTLHKDRVFYTLDGTAVQSIVYDTTATDKSAPAEVTTIRDPSASSVLGGITLHDFQDWIDFQYGPETARETFKIVWSIQTGYFIVNQFNRIVGHLYGNFTPYFKADPPRVAYSGGYIDGDNGRLYMPILRAGQPEVVNREAIPDRIVPQGQDIALFRPLGLELLELNMESTKPPQFRQIDRHALLSGASLSWIDGQSVSEFSFSEKPLIEKTEAEDYDRWVYDDLDVNAPAFSELAANEYNEVGINLAQRLGPYLVDRLRFTAVAGNTVRWIGTSANAVLQTLRFGTVTATGAPTQSFGRVERVYYDTTEKALVLRCINVPALPAGREYPQSMILNRIRYNFHASQLTGNVLLLKSFLGSNPLTIGSDYDLTIPHSESFVMTEPPQDVQLATPENDQTNIKLDRIRLSRLYVRSVSQVIRAGEVFIATAQAGFSYLNQKRHRGALIPSIRSLVGVEANNPSDNVPSITSEDVSVNFDVGDLLTDGNNLWLLGSLRGGRALLSFDNLAQRSITSQTSLGFRYLSNTIGPTHGSMVWLLSRETNNRLAVAYDFGIQAFVARRNIILDNFYNKGAGSGDTIWFVGPGLNSARAWNATTGLRDSTKDIPIGNFSVSAVFADEYTIWFVNNTTNQAIAYRVSDQRRDSRRDINLGAGDWVAGAANEGRIVIADNDTNTLKVWIYRPEVSVGLGILSGTAIQESISLAGIWTDTQNLNVVLRGPNGTYRTSQDLDNKAREILRGWTYRLGNNEYTFNIETGTRYSQGSFHYVKYSTSASQPYTGLLKSIIEDDSLLRNDTLNISFLRRSGQPHVESSTKIQPDVLSMVVSGYNQSGNAKTLTSALVRRNLIFYKPTDRVVRTSFTLSEQSFAKIDDNTAYLETRDSPLIYDASVFDFKRLAVPVIVRYPLVEVAPDVSAERLLSAHVYNYRCLFKWLDENGLEHRSQFSDVIQLIANTAIGEPGNQPTFRVNHLNLTNKLPASVSIEIYRTRDRATSFQFLKEVSSIKEAQETIITDDVVDAGLGAHSVSDNVLVSGAKYITSYKGHFVLYGFPDKPNRVLVSSPRQPFNNNAIAFRRAELPGDAIELLMEQEVKNVIAMDDFLIIFCTDQCFAWTINEGSLQQQEPAPVTGLANLVADDFKSSIEVTEGVMFNTSNGRGVHLIDRGLSWKFAGEPVKKAFTDGPLLDAVSKKASDDIVFIKRSNALEPNEPNILVYNQRYNLWTSYSDRNIISGVNWENQLTALTDSGEVFIERPTPQQETRTFVIETGWLNFTGSYLNFQRLRDIYLLAEFEGLTNLQMILDYDFIEGGKQETINYNVERAREALIGGVPIPLDNKKEWRFSPRNQQCSSVRLKITAIARTAKFDALRLGIDAGAGISGQSHQVASQRP